MIASYFSVDEGEEEKVQEQEEFIAKKNKYKFALLYTFLSSRVALKLIKDIFMLFCSLINFDFSML